MTDITLEQRARELLIAELEKIGATETARVMRNVTDRDDWWVPAAIEAALRLSAGADWNDAIEAAALEGDHWQLRSGSSHKCGEYIAGAIRTLKRPAAPRHEPGEG